MPRAAKLPALQPLLRRGLFAGSAPVQFAVAAFRGAFWLQPSPLRFWSLPRRLLRKAVGKFAVNPSGAGAVQAL